MIKNEPFIEIPTWENNVWSTTTYDTREEFAEYVTEQFKEPGKYEFDDTTEMFNEQKRLFRAQGDIYCIAPFRSRDYVKYWDFEKLKCRNGVIYKNGEGKEWYLPRDYYMWINFLPIFDKIKKDFDFPEVWDVQLHIALYEMKAELNYNHASIFKKRQIASSYFHAAKFINQLWFEPGVTLKIGASESRHIDGDGTWTFFEEYRDFLNANTGWYRPMNPNKVKNWQQKIEVTKQGRVKTVGSKGKLIGMSFEQSSTKGVGGPCRMFFYEEAGIAPTLDQTFEFIRPALNAGEITTGLFIAAGSVGKLKDCEPLKELTMHPVVNGIEPVTSNLLDETGLIGESGLFIPEQWGMPPHIDKRGNSDPVAALASLDLTFAKWKKELKPELYQLRISQHPRNIKEGFAYRDISKFPQNLVTDQKRKIEDHDYPYELIDLKEDLEGTLVVKKTSKLPITEFPVSPKLEDKTGSIVVWERPEEKPTWGTYYGSIDPVGEGKTITSESLCSIYIYKTQVEVTRVTENGVENFLEGDKIVAGWCGRFDDLNETHLKLRLIIEWYNAWTLIENNISLFIQYMIAERKQKYLVPKSQVVFLKELQANKSTYQDYGWRNVGTIFKNHLLNYLVEWVKEVIDTETNEAGDIIKKTYGISRIPDRMAMLEMEAYREGVNVDRLVSLASLVAFAKIQQANRGYMKRVENETGKDLEMSPNLHKLKSSPFRNIGKSTLPSNSKYRKRGSGFKHMK
jgi:hypothetical protein